MGRAPCCSKVGLNRGPWTPREDNLLVNYIHTHGEGNWRSLPKNAGLLRCGKSCRLRWMNYLRPDIKRGNISPDEDDLIIKLHSLLGNRWSLIAGRLPGRTDNEIKNYWNTHLSKSLLTQVTDPNTSKKLSEPIRTRQTKNRNNKKKKKEEKELIVDENIQEKPIKVHQPKPTRISSFSIPRNNSFGFCNTCSSNGTTSTYQEKEEFYYNNNNNNNIVPNWSNFKDGDDDQFIHQDLVNGSDSFECQSDENSDSLEKLYEEYFELLKTEETQVELDTFAESLLMI